MLTQSRLAELTFDQSGYYVADKLAPLIAQLRALVQSKEGVWNPETLAGVQFSLAVALALDGEQSGKNEPLAESIALNRKVQEENTRERVPLDWARTQNNLGKALRGSASGRPERQNSKRPSPPFATPSLKEWTRERVPLDWAMTQNNLGTALRLLGERESGTERLDEAVTVYRNALQVWTRERVPLQWAATQRSLGAALRVLGERESGTAKLEEAVAAFRDALKEYTRARVPLEWAKSTGNQGVALMHLAERTRDAALAETAFRQIEAASETLRAGGDTDYFDARWPKPAPFATS